ncbi:MAG: aldose 1-epimerase family protein [Pseudomonadota bacterium]
MPQIFGKDFTRRELARHVGDFDQLFGVILLTHGDGTARGARVLQFRTGSGLAFDVNVDRCMDIASLDYRGVPLGWRSPTGPRNPWLHEADGELGLGWLRSFSGIMNTCGLDHIMAPTEESAEHYNYPHRSKVRHGIHGRIAYTPARLRGYGVDWQGDDAVLWAEGEVRQAAMFGENLLLERRIEAEVGSDSVIVHDKVTSLGFYPTPHAMLYHVNFGWPLVAAGTKLVAPIKATPFMVHDPSATEIGAIEQAEPQTGFSEQVYQHEVAMEPDGTVPLALVNERQGADGFGVLYEYDGKAMPALVQWQNLQEGNYVLGLEPATVKAGSREDWKARDELIWLDHGDSRSYRLRLTPFADAATRWDVETRVSKLTS